MCVGLVHATGHMWRPQDDLVEYGSFLPPYILGISLRSSGLRPTALLKELLKSPLPGDRLHIPLHSPGCPRIYYLDQAGDLPASASRVLGLEAYITMPDLALCFIKEHKYEGDLDLTPSTGGRRQTAAAVSTSF